MAKPEKIFVPIKGFVLTPGQALFCAIILLVIAVGCMVVGSLLDEDVD